MSHLLTTRNPMSEARRQHIYGPVVSLIKSRPAGEPHPIIGGSILIGLAIIATLAIVAFTGA